MPLTARGPGSSLWLRRRAGARAGSMTAAPRFGTLVLDVGGSPARGGPGRRRPLGRGPHLRRAADRAPLDAVAWSRRPSPATSWTPCSGAPARAPRPRRGSGSGCAPGWVRPRRRTRRCRARWCLHPRPPRPSSTACCGPWRAWTRPGEVVIVDNAPAPRTASTSCGSAGFRYVREDRKGLDHARRAGLAAARGELVAFTDDDCLPARTWLAALPELFFDRASAPSRGPGSPRARDAAAGPLRGGRRLQPRPAHARVRHVHPRPGLRGAGRGGCQHGVPARRPAGARRPLPGRARRGHADAVGGDLTALAGRSPPATASSTTCGVHVRHRHRRDARSLHDTFHGYGTGMTSGLLKLLIEDGELMAPVAGAGSSASTSAASWTGRAGAATRSTCASGGTTSRAGSPHRRRSSGATGAGLRAVPRRAATPPRPPHHAAARSGRRARRARPRVARGAAGATGASRVVIPTRARPGALARCLSRSPPGRPSSRSSS